MKRPKFENVYHTKYFADNEYTGNIKYQFWFEDISLTL